MLLAFFFVQSVGEIVGGLGFTAFVRDRDFVRHEKVLLSLIYCY